MEACDYYAFGMEMAGRSYVSGARTKESYTGHERDAETGLLYAGARYYDSAIARWLVVAVGNRIDRTHDMAGRAS